MFKTKGSDVNLCKRKKLRHQQLNYLTPSGCMKAKHQATDLTRKAFFKGFSAMQSLFPLILVANCANEDDVVHGKNYGVRCPHSFGATKPSLPSPQAGTGSSTSIASN